MKTYIIIIIVIGIVACADSRTKQIRTFLKDKKGRLFFTPDSFNVKVLEKDSTYSILASKKFVNASSFRITTSINGDCYACVNELKEWELLIDKFDENKVKFLFFIYADSFARFELLNDSEINFKYPVIFDYKNDYAIKNEIPDDYLLNTMLIDSIGKIIVVGNPLKSKEIMELYEDAIFGK